MDPIKNQMISALSVSLLGYAGGMILAFPGVVLVQWDLPESKVVLSTTEASWFASIAQLVSIPGSIIGGFLVERIGPRKLILLFLPLSALAWIVIIYVVHTPWLLISVRAFQGLINTFLCVTACIYPCEIADVKRRGFLGSSIDSTFSMGFLVMYLIGGIINWQYLGYLILCITVIPCFIGAYFAPESPIWLVRHGQFAKAAEELQRIRDPGEDIHKELIVAEERARNEVQMSTLQRIQLLGKCRNFLSVFAAVTTLILKETSGQFAIVLFVFQIFQQVDFKLSSYWCSVIVGSTRLVSNLSCCFLLSKIPRRLLIGIPSIIAAFSLALLGTYFYLETWNTSYEMRFLPLVLLMVFVVCYGIGIGPVSWLLAAEMQPSAVRSIGSGIAQAGFNLVQWMIAGSFVSIKKSFGLYSCFWIYAGGCLFNATFMFFLPETKGKTLTENEDYWIGIEKKWKRLKRRRLGMQLEKVEHNDILYFPPNDVRQSLFSSV